MLAYKRKARSLKRVLKSDLSTPVRKNKTKQNPTTTKKKNTRKPVFELCFHTCAQTLPRLVPKKDTNESRFGKDCKYVWYGQGLQVHFESTLFCAVVNSSTSHFGDPCYFQQVSIYHGLFSWNSFLGCMCVRTCGWARVRLGCVWIWQPWVNSQHFPSKSRVFWTSLLLAGGSSAPPCPPVQGSAPQSRAGGLPSRAARRAGRSQRLPRAAACEVAGRDGKGNVSLNPPEICIWR